MGTSCTKYVTLYINMIRLLEKQEHVYIAMLAHLKLDQNIISRQELLVSLLYCVFFLAKSIFLT